MWRRWRRLVDVEFDDNVFEEVDDGGELSNDNDDDKRPEDAAAAAAAADSAADATIITTQSQRDDGNQDTELLTEDYQRRRRSAIDGRPSFASTSSSSVQSDPGPVLLRPTKKEVPPPQQQPNTFKAWTLTWTSTPKVHSEPFPQGVATFDPSDNAIIFWTRYQPVDEWKTSTSASLRLTITCMGCLHGTKPAPRTMDVPVKSDNHGVAIVDVSGLTASARYKYRFEGPNGEMSMQGITHTMPDASDEVASVKFAVLSCANYQADDKSFNVYDAVEETDADFVLLMDDCLNDTIYYRGVPSHDMLTKDDYRVRYQRYRSDASATTLHASRPWIVVWDDLTIARVADDTDGTVEERRKLAAEVWHEYMPARLPAGRSPLEIYRSFKIGKLVNLVLLDTRVNRTARQLNISDPRYYANVDGTSEFNAKVFLEDWWDKGRSAMGDKQVQWIASEISPDTRTWQFLASNMLMGKVELPVEMIQSSLALSSTSTRDVPALLAALGKYMKMRTELAAIRRKARDGKASNAELARIAFDLPYKFDTWDGYPFEREVLYEILRERNVVTTAGDANNAWHNNLYTNTEERKFVGTEFATMSASSPGYEGLLHGPLLFGELVVLLSMCLVGICHTTSPRSFTPLGLCAASPLKGQPFRGSALGTLVPRHEDTSRAPSWLIMMTMLSIFVQYPGRIRTLEPLARASELLSDDLQFLDGYTRGFLTVEFTPEKATGMFYSATDFGQDDEPVIVYVGENEVKKRQSSPL